MVALTQPILLVDFGCSALQDAKCLDQGRRHAVLGLIDAEVLERPLRLGTPVLVRWHLNLAKGITLGSRGGGGHSCRASMEERFRTMLQRGSRGRRGQAKGLSCSCGPDSGTCCTGIPCAQRPLICPRSRVPPSCSTRPHRSHRPKHDFQDLATAEVVGYLR